MYSAGGGPGHGGIYGQQQSQQTDFSNDMSQWQISSSTQQHQHQQSQGGQSMMYGQTSQQRQQQQQQVGRSSFFDGVQQQGTQVASQLVADFATGNLTGQKIGEKLMDGIGKGFGGGIPGLEYVMGSLRGYFAVDNRYVKRKMMKVLFPFLNKQWQRAVSSCLQPRHNLGGPLGPGLSLTAFVYQFACVLPQQIDGPEIVNYAPPISDENAPDLYLPVMSLITYCLLCALCYGTAGQFNPEVIANVTSWCMATQTLEVVFMWLGFYFMETSIPVLDLFAYTGYKYLGLTVNILFGILFGLVKDWGRTGFYLTFLWTASAAVFFMLKTMANTVPRETASNGPKRDLVVLGFAVSQAVTMWIVSQTKFL